jgi:hypothetical protein
MQSEIWSFHKIRGKGKTTIPLRYAGINLLKTLGGCLVILGALVTIPITKAQPAGTITPISTNPEGVFGNDWSRGTSLSSEGRFIAFLSAADNLVAGDTNQEVDLFIYDRLKKGVSRPVEGVTDANISADGRIISFTKKDGIESSYLYDLLGKTTVPVSEFFWGQVANGDTGAGSLSADGRFVILPNCADNLDPQGTNDKASSILLYDRVTQFLRIITGNQPGCRGEDGSPTGRLSDDGRTIVFLTTAPDLLGKNDSQGFIFYNRVLNESSVLQLNPPTGENKTRVIDYDISARGNILAYLLEQTQAGVTQLHLIVVDRKSEIKSELLNMSLPTSPGAQNSPGLSLSSNGETLAVIRRIDSTQVELSRYEIKSGNEITIDQGIIDLADISADGRIILYNKLISGENQVFVWDENGEVLDSYLLAGQVTDSTGYPLALVSITDNGDTEVRTDGEGYFWINGVNSKRVSLVPTKEGFDFDPEMINLEVNSDIQNIQLTYAHDKTLQEAQKDIGMPYNQDRGDSGPFHGYSAGYCTDLILDAFSWGVDFNIQFALEMDFKAHPWHFYRWRDARNANDMWRYFSYSGQLQPHENPYLPGDIVFFDWNQDGEIDHVALVSEVNNRNRPKKMIDATGVTNSNLSGLTAELPWEDFHERTVRGFARWSGKYEPVIPDLPSGQVFQVAVGGKGLHIRLLDLKGRAISLNEAEISGGRFNDSIWEQSLSLSGDLSSGDIFLAVITNPGKEEQAYKFTAQILQDGLVNGRVEFQGVLKNGGINRFALFLIPDQKGQLTLEPGKTNRRIEGVLRNY